MIVMSRNDVDPGSHDVDDSRNQLVDDNADYDARKLYVFRSFY